MESNKEDTKAEQFVKSQDVDIEGELDEGDIFLRDNGITPDNIVDLLSDDATQKRLVRRIDLIILPLLAGTYTLQYIDKQALSYAAVFDLFSNTGTNQDQYSWFASIFYLAYLVAEYPWSYVAQRTRMAKVVSSCVTIWGCILMLTAACHSFAGLAACRFMLGIFEAPITPCFMMIVSMWYTRQEQPFRAGVFYSCNGLGSMIGGILTYAIGQIETFPVWKAIFLICGGITAIWGGVMAFFLPDSIISAKRFTVMDKATLIARGKLARTGILNHKVRWYQVREALLDPQVWLLTLFVLLNEVVNGGYANFGKLIIKGIVQDSLRTTALGIPQGAFQVVWILGGTYMASRFRNMRINLMMLYNIPTIVGTCLIWRMDRGYWGGKIGVLLGYYIAGSFVTSLVLAMQMPGANLGGYTKRVTGTAVVFLAYCAGNIIGPHAFLDKEAPKYPTGCIVILACSVGQVVVGVCLRLLLTYRNKKRDMASPASGDANDFEDPGIELTDFENPQFRYVY